jgi:hypothetical protein
MESRVKDLPAAANIITVHIFSKDPTDRDEVVRNAQLQALACCQSNFSRPNPSPPRTRNPSSAPMTPPSERVSGSEKRLVPKQERSAESLGTAGSRLESQVNDIEPLVGINGH